MVSSPLWGIVLSRLFTWLLPQYLGLLWIYSHTFTEQYWPAYCKGILWRPLSSFPMFSPFQYSGFSGLGLFGLPAPLLQCRKITELCTWFPLPYGAALKLSPGVELGNPGAHVICVHLSEITVLCCLMSNILKSCCFYVSYFFQLSQDIR